MSVPWPYGSLVAPTPHFELGIPSQDVAYFISCMKIMEFGRLARLAAKLARSFNDTNLSVQLYLVHQNLHACYRVSDLVMRAHVFGFRVPFESTPSTSIRFYSTTVFLDVS